MNNTTIENLEAELNHVGTSLKDIERVYPKIHESFMPLSITGVSATTFLHWKKNGLIDSSTSDEEQRAWVRINLIDYVWIKIVQIMRDFGVPLDAIKETKAMMYSNILTTLIGEKEEYFQILETESKMEPERIAALKKIIEEVGDDLKNTPEEYNVHTTVIGTMITDLLIKNENISLFLIKDNGKFFSGYYSDKMLEMFPDAATYIIESPHLKIPMRKFVQDFFDDPKTEKFVERFELLSLKEKKVIEAMRKKDFKQIIIQRAGSDDAYNIDVVKDGDLMDEKAKEVKRILGLNEYSEVTIKYRNDKHLHFVNKTRL